MVLTFSPDGKMLASGGYDGIRLWDVATGQQKEFIRYKSNATNITFSPDGQTLTICSGGTVILWDITTVDKR